MEIHSDGASVNKQARIVGFTYLISSLIGLINVFWVKDGLYDPKILMESEWQFRIAQFLDLLMFVFVAWMALALYLTTRSVNPMLAKLAFLFRFGESLMGFVIVIISLVPIVLLSEVGGKAFTDAQLNSLTIMFFGISNLAWSIHFILMGIGAILFMYLLTHSSYIPKWLGYWGLLTYVTMVVCFALQILLPNFPENLMVVMAPGALFEFLFGFWLFIKGVNIKDYDRLPQSPVARAGAYSESL